METIQDCKNISEIKEKLSSSILLDEIKETCMKKNPLYYAIQNNKNLAANYYIESKLSEVSDETVEVCLASNNLEILKVLQGKLPHLFTQEHLNVMLPFAAGQCTEEIVQFLIERGAAVNSNVDLPLWTAVNEKNVSSTKVLLKHGAKITECVAKNSIQKDSFSLPVFELLIKGNIDLTFDNFYLLRRAVDNNISSALKLILERMKENNLLKDQTKVLNNLLAFAALCKFTDCAILLIQYGAIPDEFALTLAERNRDLKLAQFIRGKGVKHGCSIM